MPHSLRLVKDEAFYRKQKEEGKLQNLCAVTSIKEFPGCRIIPNAFPYTKVISSTGSHYMVIPKKPRGWKIDRLVMWWGIQRIEKEYQPDLHIFKNPTYRQSIPSICHYHLIFFERDPFGYFVNNS